MLRLKFEILCHGICVTVAAAQKLLPCWDKPLVVHDYPSTTGLLLRLDENTFVSARLRPEDQQHFVLDCGSSGFFLSTNKRGEVVAEHIEVLLPPKYALESHRLTSGKSIRPVAMTFADRVRLNPIHGCAYNCDFCTYPSYAYRTNTLQELSEALQIALNDRIMPHPHALISGGTPFCGQTEYAALNSIFKDLPAKFPALKWDLMLTPRCLNIETSPQFGYEDFIKYLHDCGLDALSVNLELNSAVARKKFIPEKEEIGRDNYLRFMEIAVKYFGPRKVRSILMVGLEDETETLKGVDDLTKRGVLVELSHFMADQGSLLAQHPEPTVEELLSVYDKSLEIAKRNGTSMEPFCVPCSHNIL